MILILDKVELYLHIMSERKIIFAYSVWKETQETSNSGDLYVVEVGDGWEVSQ